MFVLEKQSKGERERTRINEVARRRGKNQKQKSKEKSEIGKVVVEQVREVEEWWPTLLVVGKSDCRCCFVTKGEGNIN